MSFLEDIQAALEKIKERTPAANPTTGMFTPPRISAPSSAPTSVVPEMDKLRDMGTNTSPIMAPSSTPDASVVSAISAPSQPEPTAPRGFTPATASAPSGPTTLSGIPLSEFLSGAAIPEAGLKAEGRLGGRGETLTDEERAAVQADAIARQAAEMERRGSLSERDASGLTQGQRRNILRGKGVTGSAQVDMATQMGEQTDAQAAAQAQEEELLKARIAKANEPEATSYDKKVAEIAKMFSDGDIDKEEYDAAVKRAKNKALGVDEEPDSGIESVIADVGSKARKGDRKQKTDEEETEAGGDFVNMRTPEPNSRIIRVPKSDVEDLKTKGAKVV